MAENLELKERLIRLLCHKKGKSYYAEKLGITESKVESLLKEIREEATPDEEYEYTGDNENSWEVNVERGTLKSSVVSDFEPKSPEELARLHKVDLTKYRISSYWTKQRGEKFTSSLLCTLIKPQELDLQRFEQFLENFESSYTPPDVTPFTRGLEQVDLELSVADFHLDKLTIDKESISKRVADYESIVDYLISRAESIYDIRNIVFVIGNDFFHTDNALNSTTNLTPQDVAIPYNEAYEIGFKLMVEVITYLRSRCKYLEIVLVQGNHDRTKSYYMAHALSVYFSADKFIHFNRDHSTTKHVVLGNTFIGYHHGNTKIDDLPLIFATSPDSSKNFGFCKFREVHTGDKHYYLAKEIKGVRVQQLPSLSGVDRWHLDNNYINNIRAAILNVYSPIHGKIAEFEKRI